MTDPSFELPSPTTTAAPSPAAEVQAAVAASTSTLVLEAPAAVAAVAPTRAEGAVPISAADQAKLDGMVASYLDAVSTLDPHSQAFLDKVKDIGKLGDDDIRASAAVSNRLLDKPLAAMQNGGLTETSAVSKSLLNLRRQVEDLDPAKQGDMLSPHKLLGLLPFGAGDKLRDYFDKYRSSQHQIDSIITALYHGQDELQRDNAAIEQEKVNLWAVMGRLRQYSYLAQSLDTALTARIASIETTDPERAKVLKEDMLFSVRQKNQDLLTQLAVSVQGYLALDVIRRNNLELIKGVQRATTTTVSALRTAVIVAQALADQKLVLDQITALNSTTSNLIESTSELLHQQSGAINEQAASATIDLAKLQAAFTNIYATMDEIDTFKVAALDTMQKTVTALTSEIAKSQAYLDRVRANETQGPGLERTWRGHAVNARVRVTAAALVAILAAGLLAGCGNSSTPDPNSGNTLTVLAGSEVKDLAPLLPDIKSATGVSLVMSYSGTLEGAEAIAGGAATDVAWFSSGHYLSLLPGAGSRVVAQQKIMLSPVIIGVKKSIADRFGWTDNPNVTWKDIEAASADGSFKFAMTNPAASNSGLVALIGVASALSGSSNSIDTGTIDKTALRAFFKGQAMTAGSSGFLADSYVRDQDTVDGIVNYESILMSLNAGKTLHEPLSLIYPKEGIVTADYPLMLLNASKRDAYDKVTAYLRTPDVQKRIMTDTLRRPAIPGVPLDARFTSQTLIELPFPAKLETIDALITTYLDEVRKPASAIFVLDVSGSMEGDRLNQLKTAMKALTGTDTTITGQFARFRAHEQVTIITFSTGVQDVRQFTIDDTAPTGPDMTQIRDYIEGLHTFDGTAIYTGVEEAYATVEKAQAADPDRLYSIVLMTDGENNAGVDPDQFVDDYKALADPVRAVHTYTVLFGEGSKDAMGAIATLTGGSVFDATTTSLQVIFKQIRGYQ